MKTSFVLTAVCILSLSIFMIWSKLEANNHDISISINENDDEYQFSATYGKDNTRMVQGYLEGCIAPNKLFKSENDYVDVTTSLPDNTNFHIKEAPGEIKIMLNKRKNATSSYNRIKKMCTGLKQLLAGK